MSGRLFVFRTRRSAETFAAARIAPARARARARDTFAAFADPRLADEWDDAPTPADAFAAAMARAGLDPDGRPLEPIREPER